MTRATHLATATEPHGAPQERANPVLLAVAGAACISASAMFAKLSGTTAGTVAFFRCALALVVLVPLAVGEHRRVGPRPLRLRLLDVLAGLLLGIDFVFWAQSIHHVGASIATVLVSIQVVIVPLLAWVISGQRVSGRFLLTVPVMLAGVALASGAVGQPQPGSQPLLGVGFGVAAGVAYSGYLFLIRLGGGRGHTVSPVCVATGAAALAAAVIGSLWTGIDLSPGWGSLGWLAALALCGQVLAWLLIGAALPRLAANVGSALLLLQPVLAVAFGVGLLGERPTWTQIGGCALVLVTVWATSRQGNRAPAPDDA